MVLLQIYFDVSAEKAADFENMYRQVYAPALHKQQGYQASKLLRVFPPQVAGEIEAAHTEFNYQIELVFDSEADRRNWAGSPEHAVAWPQATGLARNVAWRGYDIAGSDTFMA